MIAAQLPRRAARRRSLLDEVRSRLFFIVGCERSGTTLLQAMLISDHQLTIPPETQFYATSDTFGPPPGSRRRPRQRENFLTWVIGEQLARGLQFDAYEFRLLADMAGDSRDDVFVALMAAVAAARGVAIVGEKSPNHTRYVTHLARTFPQARFVHMIRDPRAVMASLLAADWAPELRAPNILQWRGAARLHLMAARDLGKDRYLPVRYEELVAAPEATLRCVTAFLGVDFSARMLEHHRRTDPGQRDVTIPSMQNTTKPVFTSSVDRWKDDLHERDIAMVEELLGSEMQALGYSLLGRTDRFAHLRFAAERGLWRAAQLVGTAKARLARRAKYRF